MPYSHTQLAYFRLSLATRLGDPNRVFWTDAELNIYIADALRHWSLLSQYTKVREQFETTPNVAFYDLSSLYEGRTYTVTDTDVVKAIQHHLMEPATGISWTGSEQFSYQEVLDALTRRRNKFLLETGCVLTAFEQDSDPPPVTDLALSDTIIDVRRVAWKTPEGTYRNLRQQDTTGLRGFAPAWSYNPGTALSYIRSSEPHVSIRFAPPSIDAGRVHLVVAEAKTQLTGQGNLLGIPDDFAPVLKWGVLADLLNNEKSADRRRADYCEKRWQEGIGAAKFACSIWGSEVNGVPTNTSALEELDSYFPTWQSLSGHPRAIGLAGMDLIALAPVPDDRYSVLMDLTSKMPVPVTDADFIQVGREHLDTILDYCIHLASFKQGGEMFSSTLPLFDAFLRTAQMQNARLKAQSMYMEIIKDQSYKEQRRRPREVEAAART